MSLLAHLDHHRPLPALPPGALDLWSQIDRTIAARLAHHWTPPPELPLEDYFRQRLRIAGNQSASDAGKPLDLRKNPQSRVILDFLLDPHARELNIEKSSAGGISTTVIAACVHMLERDPGNILYLIGSADEARKISAVYWRPFLRQIFGPIADDKSQAALHFKIAGVEIILGSPTEEQMRGKQFKVIIEDESDTMEDTLIGGAQDLDVAEDERTKNAAGSKIIRLCCPLYAYDPAAPKDVRQPLTRINRHYQRGDRREFRCPCPACGVEHPIKRENLITDHCRDLTGLLDLDRVAEETYWSCPTCSHQVPDTLAAKTPFFDRGRHVPTSKPLSRTIWSAKVTDLAVLFGKAASWGFVESALLKAESESEDKLAATKRSHLAEPRPREKEGASRTIETLLRHCSHYDRGTCPIIPHRVYLAADVQKDATYFPWLLSAVNQRGDLFVIDWGEASDTDELETLRTRPLPVHCTLPPHLLEKFPTGIVPPVYVTHAVIDSGHHARGDEVDNTARSVYSFVHRCGFLRTTDSAGHTTLRYKWVPLKGRGESQINCEIKTSTAHLTDAIILPLVLFKDPSFKSELYHIQLAYDPTPGAPDSKIQSQARALPRILLPRYRDDAVLAEGQIPYSQFLQELQAERYGSVMQKPRNGAPAYEVRKWYVPSGLANNFGDCLKMTKVLHAATPVA